MRVIVGTGVAKCTLDGDHVDEAAGAPPRTHASSAACRRRCRGSRDVDELIKSRTLLRQGSRIAARYREERRRVDRVVREAKRSAPEAAQRREKWVHAGASQDPRTLTARHRRAASDASPDFTRWRVLRPTPGGLANFVLEGWAHINGVVDDVQLLDPPARPSVATSTTSNGASVPGGQLPVEMEPEAHRGPARFGVFAAHHRLPA